MKKYRKSRGKKEIKLKGEIYGKLPFDDLEKYTDVKIENLGILYKNNIYIENDNNFLDTTIYKIGKNLFIIDAIVHFNTELISAKLIKLI